MIIHYVVRWHTPDKYLNAIREVMGGIDLDPATDEKAQERIKAGRYYTAETNGLDKDWMGTVILCPPFEPGLIDQFVDKAIKEYGAGHTTQLIGLVHTWEPHSSWFQNVVRNANGVCFPKEPIEWVAGHDVPAILGNSFNPKHENRGMMVAYFGNSVERFRDVFNEFGVIR